jgi:lysozyme
MRHVNKAGLDLVKSFEKCVLHPYDDGAGYMTIGWGHLIRRGEHFDKITQAEADELLRHDLADAEHAVESQVKVPLTDNQFGALVSFAFNVGAGGLGRSSMLRALNRGEYGAVPERLKVWNKAGGKVLRGLTRRRKAEGDLFKSASGVAGSAPPERMIDSTPLPSSSSDSDSAAPRPVVDAPAVAGDTTNTTTIENAGVVNAPAETPAPTPGGAPGDPTQKVTSGSGSWARGGAAWITTLFATASGYVERAFGLTPDVQKWLLIGVAVLGVAWLVLKGVAEWQVRHIAASPALRNVK